jgi:hypothetical protein
MLALPQISVSQVERRRRKKRCDSCDAEATLTGCEAAESDFDLPDGLRACCRDAWGKENNYATTNSNRPLTPERPASPLQLRIAASASAPPAATNPKDSCGVQPAQPHAYGLLEGLVAGALDKMTPYYDETKKSSAFLKASIEKVEGGLQILSGPVKGIVKGIDSQLESRVMRPAGHAVDAAYAAASHLQAISSSLVREFVQRLYEMRLIPRSWHDLFQHCIQPIQNALTLGGFYETVWIFSFQPHRAISTQVVKILAELKQAVYMYLLSSTHVSSWVVECFLRRMLEEQAIQPWAMELMDGLKCRVDFARQLTVMGLTNGTFVHGLLEDGETLAALPLPAEAAVHASKVLHACTTHAERRKSLLDRIKLAAIWRLVCVDHLLSCLVLCLVQRLLDDQTISPAMHARWITDDSVRRITLHLQQQRCTNDGLCKFVLSESLDLRKFQLVRQIEECLQADPVSLQQGA